MKFSFILVVFSWSCARKEKGIFLNTTHCNYYGFATTTRSRVHHVTVTDGVPKLVIACYAQGQTTKFALHLSQISSWISGYITAGLCRCALLSVCCAVHYYFCTKNTNFQSSCAKMIYVLWQSWRNFLLVSGRHQSSMSDERLVVHSASFYC